MKTKTKIQISIIIFFITLAFFASMESIKKNNIIQTKNQTIDSLQNIIKNFNDSINYITALKNKQINDYFKIAKKFNSSLKKETIQKFFKTIEIFNLNKNKNLYFFQLIYESGFQQFYSANHKKQYQLVKSSKGAIGIAQIKPSTAYDYFKKLKSEKQFKQLNCTDFQFYKNFKNLKPTQQQLIIIKNWLSIETNNIAMWGMIMKHLLKKYKKIDYSFIAYNAGEGYLKRVKKHHYNCKQFIYLKKIRQLSILYSLKKTAN